MESYSPLLKKNARKLRASMTDAEQALWYRLRRKQIRGVQFYRQKPIMGFIVDFYCAKARLVIELDGSQHLELEYSQKDDLRDKTLKGQGLKILRFDNRQVLTEMNSVLTVIGHVVEEQILNPP